jgi:hypothetical protein
LLGQLPAARLAFIDGDHTFEGTLRYHAAARATMPAGSMLVFDDIDWSDGMREAWKKIAASCPDDQAFGEGGMGYVIT